EEDAGVACGRVLLGGVRLGAEDTAAPYSVAWNTTPAANGTHTLAARARDASGNVATSAAVSVTVFNDLTPPTVSLTAPANAATVSGTVDVTATAAGNAVFVGVQLLRYALFLGAALFRAPYSVAWNTTPAANATHTLAARARDASGNVATSAAVTVTVFNDLIAPTVSLTAPANAATVSGTITVSATAADNIGVAGVQFLLGNVASGAEGTAAPYSVAWNTTTAANGTHTLAARARDASGNVATSAAVTVTVNNTPTMVQNVSNTQPLSLANTSPSITPAANTLIVALISAGPRGLGLGGGATAVDSVPNTDAAPTWTRAARPNNQ